MYVQVLINRNIGGLYKTFQYKVPLNLQKKIAIGMRIVVPFGSSFADGFVLKIEDKVTTTKPLKEIISIIDSELTLNKEMISLAFWMSEQYLCSLALCLRCFLPSGSLSKVRKYITVNLLEDVNIDTTEKDIVDYILKKEKVLYNSLLKKFSSQKTLIKNLIKKNILSEKYLVDSGVREKKYKKAYLIKDKEYCQKVISKNATKQREIIEILAKEKSMFLKDIVKKTNCSYSTIAALEKKELVKITEEIFEGEKELNKIETFKKLLPEQEKALEKLSEHLNKGEASRFLLHGVTGSGKTEVYLRLVEKTINSGKQAIVLVPEISLTHNLVKHFRKKFGEKVAILHSGIPDSEKYNFWCKIKRGECMVVLGARSAVFAPCENLGLIIIDEEHEWSYKQDTNPKYHTKEVAWKRVQINKGLLLLGSATPSIETYWRAKSGNLFLLEMKNRVHKKPLPPVKVVDMRKELASGNYNIFSRELLNSLHENWVRNESSILLVNRRGFASFVLCKNCGYVFKCPNCQVSLTLHKDTNLLQCHYCNYKQPILKKCPQCNEYELKPYGIGTQRVEEDLKKIFGPEKIFRVDSDTTSKKGSLENLLTNFENKGGIMVGTQIVAKGLDFSDVTFVGVIDSDSILNLPDFRARERGFQLFTQVAGRAGRGSKEGRVIIQTYNPQNISIITAQKHAYSSFFKTEIRERKRYNYPPFVHLISLTVSHSKEENVIKAARVFKSFLEKKIFFHTDVVKILGPAPALIPKIKNLYRWQIYLKSKNLRFARNVVRNAYYDFYKNYNNLARIDVDVNPFGIV